MRIAFYAPLKPPDHPVPSGDRRMARLLMAALKRGGHTAVLASRLRSRAGQPQEQAAIAARAQQTAARLVERYRSHAGRQRLDAWLTYHLYYKAPDWLGPPVCEALGIPYLVAEASHANKRAAGLWAPGHEAAARAIRRAEAIFTINPADAEGLLPLVETPTRLVALKPFLEDSAFERPDVPRGELRAGIAARLGLDAGAAWLLAVAMMRPGDKLASYRASRGRWPRCQTGRPGSSLSSVTGRRAPQSGRRWTRCPRIGCASLASCRPRPCSPSMRRPTCSSGRRSTRPMAWRCWRRRPPACRRSPAPSGAFPRS